MVTNETHQLIFASGFCLENFISHANKSKTYVSAFLCRMEEPETKQRLPSSEISCSTSDEFDLVDMNQKLRFWLTVSGFVSIFFLLLTLCFYITLPDLCNFQGSIICAYILSIILTTVLLVVIYNVKRDYFVHEADSKDEFFIIISDTTCKFLGYFLYFSGILMFCWMSLLCFDLFWTFVCTPIQLQNKKNNRRLCVYLVIGFGVPVILTVAIYIIDVLKSFKLRPNVGRDGCFLSAMGARYFFNIPILVLLAFNTLIFLITTFSLWSSFQANKFASMQQSSQRHKVCCTVLPIVL